eukprot:3936868-Rhodomonas_salina.2
MSVRFKVVSGPWPGFFKLGLISHWMRLRASRGSRTTTTSSIAKSRDLTRWTTGVTFGSRNPVMRVPAASRRHALPG